MKHSTQKHMIAFVLMILVGGCFVSVQSAQAFLSVWDNRLNPLMDVYTPKDIIEQQDKIRSNVQRQTGESLNSGNPYPIPRSWASALGVAKGIGASAVVSATTGGLNFKTAMKTVVKTIITSVMNDITKWAKGGFRGKPNFIADWKGSLESSLLDASAEFIGKLPLLSALCSPASVSGPSAFFPTVLSVAKPTLKQHTNKSFQPTNKCNIETVITNATGATTTYKNTLEKFANSWDKKGGSAMATALMSPSTNNLGLYFQAKDESMMRVNKGSAAKQEEAKANSGFLNISNGCIGGAGSGSARAPSGGIDARAPRSGVGASGGVGICGDGAVNNINANGWPEQCDGANLAGPIQCSRFADFQSGTLACLPSCSFDYSGCTRNSGTGNPLTGEKFCPGIMAGEFVKDTLNTAGLGQFDDLIDSNDLADLFSAIAQSAFASITESMSSWLKPLIANPIKNTSF